MGSKMNIINNSSQENNFKNFHVLYDIILDSYAYNLKDNNTFVYLNL